MIQRIQSIYLLSSSLLLFFLLNGTLGEIITENQLILHLDYAKIASVTESSFSALSVWPLTALIFGVMGLGLITIFLYKKRTLQMRFCMFTILLTLGIPAMIYYYTKLAPLGLERSDSIIQLPVVVPFISSILSYLALKAIQKDDALVKSYERLR